MPLEFEGVERFGTAQFVYVYDCGSIPRQQVRHQVRALRRARPNRELDMLFLSHFDLDHICGTPDLLDQKTGFHVGTIVLPFVDDVERIIGFARAAAARAETGATIPRFYADMVVDPIETLEAFGPDQIILVGGPGDDDADRREEAPVDPPGSARGDSLPWKIVPSDGDDWQGTRVSRVPGAPAGVTLMRAAAISIGDRTWTLDWRLYPWVKPADPAAVVQFRIAVEKELKWPSGDFAVRMADKAQRRRAVTVHRMALARAYKLAFKDKNLTSLCLFSGPTRPDEGYALNVVPDLPDCDTTKIGWLGTGDAHLAAPNDIALFEQAYHRDLKYVSTFMFPHHGSIENSDPYHLISNADIWVAAADPVHDWEHPHWTLHAAVAARGALFRHVRAWPATALDEAILFCRPQDAS